MADVHAANPSTAQPTGEPSKTGNAVPATASTEAEKQQAVLAETLQKLQEQVNSQSAMLRRLTEAQNAKATPAVEEPKTVEGKLGKLQEEVRADREALALERRDTAIESAMVSHKIDGDSAKLLKSFILFEHGKSISIEGKEVIHKDPVTGDRTLIADFIGNLLKGSFGDKFRPAADLPSSNSLRSGNVPGPAGQPDPTKMTPEQYTAWRVATYGA